MNGKRMGRSSGTAGGSAKRGADDRWGDDDGRMYARVGKGARKEVHDTKLKRHAESEKRTSGTKYAPVDLA